ncbi:MAG: 3-deoxy-D-manno-octulosonic acid transferase [Saprospiraceae bacterium]|nr:3-deoxy-D-manno-octulosonic acid transferase [Saprospiraceae bacterium]
MVLLYTIAIRLYGLGIFLASFFSEKARLWIEGRKNWAAYLQAFNQKFPEKPGQERIWVHCASLGEFEQGRTLIEFIKSNSPETLVILTFFSPSGYEIRKNYAHADAILYLPLDTKTNARRFLQLVRPDKAIFVKYEFWHHYLAALQKTNIATVVISAIFRPEQIFFKPYGGFFRNMLHALDHLFVQDQASVDLLGTIGISSATKAGDTRIDRVAQIPTEGKHFPKVAAFVGEAPCMIVGSSWGPDEAVLKDGIAKSLPENWKIILAPHDISEAHLASIEKLWAGQVQRYSTLSSAEKGSGRFLLIDNIGMLQSLYRYGKIAYIGGGFGAGIHNTLEPITFGLPVIFGPKFQKFEEAKQLLRLGGGFTISSAEELAETLDLLLESETYEIASERAKAYIEQNQGGTQKIAHYLGIAS